MLVAHAASVGAHNSVVGADQGLRAPSWDQESVHDSVHEDSASAPSRQVNDHGRVAGTHTHHAVTSWHRRRFDRRRRAREFPA